MCIYTVAAYLVIMVWHPLLYTIGFIDIFFPMKKKKNNNSIMFSRWLTEWKHIWNRISIDKIKFNKKKKTSEGLWDNIERETCRLQLLLMSIILFKHLSINRDDRGDIGGGFERGNQEQMGSATLFILIPLLQIKRTLFLLSTS